jgi:serine/threonine protein kinase
MMYSRTWSSQLLDVLSGLSYLHTNHIVHGDIKGANVLVDPQGRARLADLGSSRLTDAHILTWTSIVSTTPSSGTLLWQAPELLSAQLRGAERLPFPTTLSDMYAFGCLAYEVSCTVTTQPFPC